MPNNTVNLPYLIFLQKESKLFDFHHEPLDYSQFNTDSDPEVTAFIKGHQLISEAVTQFQESYPDIFDQSTTITL